MSTHPVIARLAAANPFPPTAPRTAATRSLARRRALIAAVAALVVALPAVALGTDVGGLFGFSTEGEPIATGDTPFGHDSGLEQAMTDLGFPSTLQLIATRDGIAFYAARRADGHFCFAVDAEPGAADHKGVGCDLGNPSLPGEPAFPSPARPIIDFSQFSSGQHLVGFAADGVASVDLLDAAGSVIASAPVSDNVYAVATPPPGGAAVEALDARGTVVYERTFGEAP
jgi:hypothetical protein